MTRSNYFRGILLALVLALLQGLSGYPANAQNREEAKIEVSDLEEAIELLENPEEARRVAERLRSLLEARKELEEPDSIPETLTIQLTSNIFKIYDFYKSKAKSVLSDIRNQLGFLPLSSQAFHNYISRRENMYTLLSIGIKFAIALVLAFAAGMIMRRVMVRLRKKVQWREPLSMSKRAAAAVLSTSFKVYPWLVLFFFCSLFLTVVPVHAALKVVVLYELLALVVYLAMKYLLYFVLSPESSEYRVAPVSDQTSGRAFVWGRRLLRFSLAMYAVIIPCAVLEQVALKAVLTGSYKLGIVVMAAVVLIEWRGKIEAGLCRVGTPDDPPWKASMRKVCNFMVGKLYVIGIVYLALVVLVPVLGFPNAYAYLVYSSLKSVVVIVLALGAWLLLDAFHKKLVGRADGIKRRYAEYEGHLDRYVYIFRRFSNLMVTLLAGIALLEVWGTDVLAFFAANGALVRALIHIPLILAAGAVLLHLADFLIGRLEKRIGGQMLANGKTPPVEVEKRISTLGRVIRKASTVTVVAVVVMMVFSELGFDIKPVLAGAGVVGLAVGFGAQNLVRDIISGLFLIVENRIRVGDVVIINGTGGSVEQVNPRTTVLRSLDGTIHVFPNGSITSLSNMTYEYGFYVFNIGVAYKEDVDRVIEVLREIGDEIVQDAEYRGHILEPIEILGLDQFADSAVVIKARIKTVPIKQWFVGREMNRRIKKRFDELGIEIPFPHSTLYFGEASKPIAFKLEASDGDREELKELVREVMKESLVMEKRTAHS